MMTSCAKMTVGGLLTYLKSNVAITVEIKDRKCHQTGVALSILNCPYPSKVGEQPCTPPPHGMDVAENKTDVTSKSSWILFSKRGVVEKVHSREKAIHICKESVLSRLGEPWAPLTPRLENSLDVRGKESQCYFLVCNAAGQHEDPSKYAWLAFQ